MFTNNGSPLRAKEYNPDLMKAFAGEPLAIGEGPEDYMKGGFEGDKSSIFLRNNDQSRLFAASSITHQDNPMTISQLKNRSYLSS
jgi:hypothetical protein